MSRPEVRIEASADPLAFARQWPSVLAVGIITIVIGIVVLSWPGETLAVLSILLGLQFVFFGLSRVVTAFSGESPAGGLIAFVGVLLMISGVIILRHPFQTVAILATIIGVAWIIAGSIDVLHAVSDQNAANRGLRILGGLVSLVAGVIVVAWPGPTLGVIAWIAGLQLVVAGAFIAASAFALRGAAKA